MSLTDVIRVIRAAGVEATGRELAEVLWLAQHLAAPVPSGPEPPPQPEPSGDEPSTGRESPQAPAITPPPTSVPLGVPRQPSRQLEFHGHPVRVPELPGMQRQAAVQRALRPLRRRGPAAGHQIIDEEATATFIASTGIWSPVMRPAQERWFDLILVVDTSPSMELWRPLVDNLRQTLTRTGAFRDIRLWWLTPGAENVLRPTPATPARSPRELVDATGRRLFLVVTDAAADAWHNGTVLPAIAQWARTGPVAVLQPLPEAMWHRTGLVTTPARLSTHLPGTPNNKVRTAYRRRRHAGGVPIPVLGVEPAALNGWASVVAGTASAVPLAVIPSDSEPTGAPPPSEVTDPRAHLDRFRAGASPQAYKLAVLLSAVPLTLPIMRLVHHALASPGSASALAEVVLSGLLVRTGHQAYEFRPGIRDLLVAQLRRSEAVIVLSTVTRFIAERAGAVEDTFPAVAGRSDGPVAVDAQAFSWVPPETAARLGLSTGSSSGTTETVDGIAGRLPPLAEHVPELRASRTVGVAVPDRLGSGCHVAHGLVLTAATLIGNTEQVSLRLNSGRFTTVAIPGHVIWADRRIGLALIQFSPPPELRPLPPLRYASVSQALPNSIVDIRAFNETEIRAAGEVQGFLPASAGFNLNAVLPGGDVPIDLVGSPVWYDARLIGVIQEHGPNATTTEWNAAVIVQPADDPSAEPLHRALGITDRSTIEQIPATNRDSPRSQRLSHLRQIGINGLIGRHRELDEMLAFCSGAEPYLWWQGHPRSGRTALMAAFTERVPETIEVISYFPDVDGETEAAFPETVTSQLATITGERTVPPGTMRHDERQALLYRAVERLAAAGRGLLLLVDGIDRTPAGIAGLLPDARQGLHIIVTSEAGYTLPPDLPTDHPLRRCRPRLLNPPTPKTDTAAAPPATTAEPTPAELQRLFDRYRAEFGPDHLRTLIVTADLAWARRQTDDPDHVRATLERILPAIDQALGSDHQVTFVNLLRLALVQMRVRDPRRVDTWERVVHERTRELGPEHPATLDAKVSLAKARNAFGERESAFELLKSVVDTRRRQFGAEHPDTLNAQGVLEQWRSELTQPTRETTNSFFWPFE